MPVFEGIKYHIKDMGDISHVGKFRDNPHSRRAMKGVEAEKKS